MRTIRMRRRSHFLGILILAATLPSVSGAVPADATGKEMGRRAESRDAASETLRPIRVAVLEIDVLDGVGAKGSVIADRLDAMLSKMPGVTVLNRRQIEKVAEEHQIALSGLAEGSSAARLGRFLSAQYILVGRASTVDGRLYLALKLVDVETTEQKMISIKSDPDDGLEGVFAQLNEPLTAQVRRLQWARPREENQTLAELHRCAKPLSGKRVLLAVEETHVDRPLRDPAAQTALMKRLRKLGMSVIAPTDPEEGWKKTLLQTGKYGSQEVDFLLEGEGTSAFAARIDGLVSCRARVELRAIPLPGRAIVASDRGVAAGVDLVESLAAKTALEEAAIKALDALVREWAENKESAR